MSVKIGWAEEEPFNSYAEVVLWLKRWCSLVRPHGLTLARWRNNISAKKRALARRLRPKSNRQLTNHIGLKYLGTKE